ncbi:hypothetical protein GCM10010483_35130 [Actinokineospora diospyrosa]
MGRLAPASSGCRGLGWWVGADLTGSGLAPPGPGVQGLALWVGADLTAVGWHRGLRVSSGFYAVVLKARPVDGAVLGAVVGGGDLAAVALEDQAQAQEG